MRKTFIPLIEKLYLKNKSLFKNIRKIWLNEKIGKQFCVHSREVSVITTRKEF